MITRLLLLALTALTASAQVMLPHRHFDLGTVSTNPPCTSGLIVWLSADTFNGVVPNGGTITNWLDGSGNGNYFTNTSGVSSTFPTYSSNLVNGHGAVVFNCTNHTRLNASGAVSGWYNAYTSYHIFYVLKTQTTNCPTAANIDKGLGLDGFTFNDASFATADQTLWPDKNNSPNKIKSSFFRKNNSLDCGFPIVALDQWNEMNTWSATNDFGMFIRKSSQFAIGTNTVGGNVNNLYATLGVSLYHTALPSTSEGYFNGWIAEMLIFDHKLDATCQTNIEDWLLAKYGLSPALNTPVTTAAASTPTSGLQGWWRFDDNTASSTAVDSSGNSSNGTIYNGPGFYAAHNANGFSANGANRFGLMPEIAATRIANNFTVCFWTKINSPSQSNCYVVNRNNVVGTKQASIIYGFVANKVEFFAQGFTGSDPRTGSQLTISDSNWHHVAYTYDGVTWTGYLDGASVFSVSRTFSLATDVQDGWYVGGSVAGANAFPGLIDELRIYNRALSGAEVVTVMND